MSYDTNIDEWYIWRNKNNQTPYITNEKQVCKTVALLKSSKRIYVRIFRIHIPESNFKSNKHIYKISNFVNMFITREDRFWNVNPKY